jgi:hypothetical protein
MIMNKNFVVVDLYEGVDVVAECDTLAEVFARITEREADTDGECNVVYYNREVSLDRIQLRKLGLN